MKHNKSKLSNYWPDEMDQWILEYQKAEMHRRNEIYEQHLHVPFSKLCEVNVNLKSTYGSPDQMQEAISDCLYHLILLIDRWTPERGKSFSFFNVCLGRFVFQRNMKEWNKENMFLSIDRKDSDEDSSLLGKLESPEVMIDYDFNKLKSILLNKWSYDQLTDYLKTRTDIRPAQKQLVKNFWKRILQGGYKKYESQRKGRKWIAMERSLFKLSEKCLSLTDEEFQQWKDGEEKYNKKVNSSISG